LFTAIAVIDRLGSVFEAIFQRPLQTRNFADKEGAVRVIANRSDAAGLVNAGFDPIRQAGARNPSILIRIADAFEKLAPVLDASESREAVLAQLARLAETTAAADLPSSDLRDVLDRIGKARTAIAAGREHRRPQRNAPPANPGESDRVDVRPQTDQSGRQQH
jgi:uncharacterized membrane protein